MSGISTLFHAAGAAPRELYFGTVHNILTGGNHRPLLCQLEDFQGPAGFWVVKPQVVLGTTNHRTYLRVLAELVGSEICAWAGVLTPETGLVRFPEGGPGEEELWRQAPEAHRKEVRELCELNRGKTAFCCRFIEGAINARVEHFRRHRPISAEMEVAIQLFSLDLYLRHDDRRTDNSNALWLDGELIAIDHGSALGGLDRPGEDGAGLALRTVIENHYKQHFLLPVLREWSGRLDLDLFASRLGQLTDPLLDDTFRQWRQVLGAPTQIDEQSLDSRALLFLKHRRRQLGELTQNIRQFLGRLT